ncbi:MAG: hypothetical protein WD598_13610 [Acidimicrobiia bacterium]
MQCPWCDFEGTPRALHAHLGEEHPERVRFEERGPSRFYGIDCPICDEGYEHVVKPRLRDPGFMEEFQREIRLVAFDMLVNHLLAEHTELAGDDDEDVPSGAT